MVVVVAGGEQDHGEPVLAGVGGHAEAERVAVEAERAVEIGDAQVHVTDADGGMDGFVLHARQFPARRVARHRCNHLTEPRE